MSALDLDTLYLVEVPYNKIKWFKRDFRMNGIGELSILTSQTKPKQLSDMSPNMEDMKHEDRKKKKIEKLDGTTIEVYDDTTLVPIYFALKHLSGRVDSIKLKTFSVKKKLGRI